MALIREFVVLSLLFVGVLSRNIGRNTTNRAPSEDDIHFYLFTRYNGADHPNEINLDTLSLIEYGYNPSVPTILLSHGFQSEGVGFTKDFARAYFEVGEFNVFAIDWERLAMWYDYFGAAVRTKFVGEYSAKLVQLLAENGGIQNVHLIGHSLGAHVVGFLGKRVQELGYGKVKRITGLDPAEPAFDLAGPNGRLDKDDAEFVDIIHSNSGMLWEGCLSIPRRIGHMDFYPAGGKHQPGCKDICVGNSCTENNINDLIKGGCSHDRANRYYIESIRASSSRSEQLKFSAVLCSSWDSFLAGNCCSKEQLLMGHSAVRGAEGKYMLNVGEESPFAVGEDWVSC